MEEAKMVIDESDEGEIIINEVDGLPDFHDGTYSDTESRIGFIDSANLTFDELINDEDLPMSLIVTNIDAAVFHNDELKPVTPIDAADKHLQLPPPVKQFLISPPSSPPVGWEPREEAEPLINYDLIAALASLTPGVPHELLAPSDNQPGIVVHVCDDGTGVTGNMQSKPKIMHTSRPENNL